MRLKVLRLIGLLALGVLSAPLFTDAQEGIFLVRHAEQLAGAEDPPLTEAGQRRARTLAALLKDAGINVIYTSESRRTIQTAEPLSKALNVESRAFPRRDTDGLIGRLRAHHASDRVLIVSHSLTVPTLLKALGHPREVQIPLDEYDSLFVIVPKSNGSPVVLRLRY